MSKLITLSIPHVVSSMFIADFSAMQQTLNRFASQKVKYKSLPFDANSPVLTPRRAVFYVGECPDAAAIAKLIRDKGIIRL